MSLTLRSGNPEDAEACGPNCFDASRRSINITTSRPTSPLLKWQQASCHSFSRPDVYSVVAEMDGRIVGSNFLWEGDSIAVVGQSPSAPTFKTARLAAG
jgi:hypothetical protein